MDTHPSPPAPLCGADAGAPYVDGNPIVCTLPAHQGDHEDHSRRAEYGEVITWSPAPLSPSAVELLDVVRSFNAAGVLPTRGAVVLPRCECNRRPLAGESAAFRELEYAGLIEQRVTSLGTGYGWAVTA